MESDGRCAMSRGKKGETPEAIAARAADEYFARIAYDAGSVEESLRDGIVEVYEALNPGSDEERNHVLAGRANYIVGVQIGLRMRNVGGAR
jgi:RNA 3'-terminal phosphate cyclase